MKPVIPFLAFALLLGPSRGEAQTTNPQPNPQAQPADIPLKLQGANTSDALLELARAANVNFLADATHFPTEPNAVAVDSTVSLEQHLTELSDRYSLTWLPKGSMVLVWAEPDIHQLAERIVGGEKVRLLPIPEDQETVDSPPQKDKLPAQKTPTARERLLADINQYLQTQLGFDGSVPGARVEVPISQLPPELRDRVIPQIQAGLIRQDYSPTWESWFQNDYWKAARLQVIMEGTGHKGQTMPLLMVGINFRDARGSHGSSVSLGKLEKVNP